MQSSVPRSKTSHCTPQGKGPAKPLAPDSAWDTRRRGRAAGVDSTAGSRAQDADRQISRNNLPIHSYSRVRVFGREFLMTMKMVIAPLTLVSLAVLLVYAEPHLPCLVMILAKFAGHVSL